MERHTVNLWAWLLLPLGATLPIGCDLATSNQPVPGGVVHSQPSLASADDSQWPLRRIAPPQIVPVDYSGPFGSVEVLPAEVATTPFEPSNSPSRSATGPELTPPRIEAGSRYSSPRGGWSDEVPPTRATIPADAAPVVPDAELLPPFGSSEDREVSLPSPSGEQVGVQPTAPEQAPAEFERTELPWARPMVRSSEFQAILKRAHDLNQRAFELATRGAHFSARSRFAESLHLVACALDSQRTTEAHSRALAAGLTALDEAADFAPPGAATRRELNMAGIIAHHRTSILKNEPSDITALTARKRYYTYAQEQLALAAGQELPSSEALFGLGKLALAKSSPKEPAGLESMACAMVCYQASLMVDPNNFRSANELGVLMAQAGRFEAARDLFVRSVAAAPHPSTLQNLAVVYHQMGDPVAAAQTRSQAERLAKSMPSTQQVPIKWVDSATFNSTASTTDGLMSPPAPAPAAPAASPGKKSSEAKATTAKKSTWDWLPWR